MGKYNDPNKESALVGVKELAGILDLSYGKTLNLVKYSDLASIKLGNSYYVARGNLKIWLESSAKRAYNFKQ